MWKITSDSKFRPKLPHALLCPCLSLETFHQPHKGISMSNYMTFPIHGRRLSFQKQGARHSDASGLSQIVLESSGGRVTVTVLQSCFRESDLDLALPWHVPGSVLMDPQLVLRRCFPSGFNGLCALTGLGHIWPRTRPRDSQLGLWW